MARGSVNAINTSTSCSAAAVEVTGRRSSIGTGPVRLVGYGSANRYWLRVRAARPHG